MADALRVQVNALWLFHGEVIERSLRYAASQMDLAERAPETEPGLRKAAADQRERINAALAAFLALGEELQK